LAEIHRRSKPEPAARWCELVAPGSIVEKQLLE
jgi:hypothetical protein